MANRLQLGVEFNPAAREFAPLANLFLFTETNVRPAAVIGTSSDRVGSPPKEQAYFLTIAKRLPSVPISAYATINYSEWDNGFNFPFGASIDLGNGFTVRGMYDGVLPHLMLNYYFKEFSLSLMYISIDQSQRPGIALSSSF
ncbi:MAG: hypothetical protein OXP71_02400 [Candidatus Poribacteria bacterium]|nr:hypothetical protein [Candidatus Poribacteria bacterium]